MEDSIFNSSIAHPTYISGTLVSSSKLFTLLQNNLMCIYTKQCLLVLFTGYLNYSLHEGIVVEVWNYSYPLRKSIWQFFPTETRNLPFFCVLFGFFLLWFGWGVGALFVCLKCSFSFQGLLYWFLVFPNASTFPI